jgi:hypothetical protein
MLIVLAGTSPAWSQLPEDLPRVPFSQKYLEAHRDVYQFVTPEAYELANILVVLTNWGRTDKAGNFFLKTDYAGEVFDHFDQYTGHPIFESLNQIDLSKFDNLVGLRENSFAFYFEGDTLRKYPFFGKYRDSDWVPPLWDEHREQIEDFARVSGYRAFYAAHRDFYKAQIADLDRTVDLRRIRAWLEREFPLVSYESYYIMLSPLTRGQHSLADMFGRDMNQLLAVVAGPRFGEVSRLDPKVTLTRMVFTEIDHAYVNPDSFLRHGERINTVLKDHIDYWRGQKGGSYRTPESLFNEMMTWAVFLLYAKEHLPDQFQETELETVRRMEERRGFPRFGEFYRELQARYDQREENQRVTDLVEGLISWMETQHMGG